jgi:hypothetical protein
MAGDHEYITEFSHDVVGLFNTCILKAAIVEVDYDNDLADINIIEPALGSRSNIPIFYHCENASTIKGGSAAFEPDDEVLVFCKNCKGGSFSANTMKIVGFVDGLKSCCVFKEHWGATLCENNDWRFTLYSKCELPTSGVTLANGIISVSRINRSHHVLQKYYEFIPVGAELAPREIKIKITANASGSPPLFSIVMLFMRFHPRQFVQLMFAINQWEPTQWEDPPTVYIGDNGGAEQIITLSDHFTIPEDSTLVGIEMSAHSSDAGHSASFDLDYIEIKGKCIS